MNKKRANLRIRKTRESWNATRHAHFITYSCHDRLPLLRRERACIWVIDAMKTARERHNVDLWAYVIMPEHVHILLCPKNEQYEMRKILASLKRPVAKAARDWLTKRNDLRWLNRLTIEYPSRTVFRFWQPGGGYDRNILHGKTVPAIIDYVHANPVRRGLVSCPTNWRWSSAGFWDNNDSCPIAMDRPYSN